MLCKVSIHAPTRGATPGRQWHVHPARSFNPRSHAGSDRDGQLAIARRIVSIHAPTRGATTTMTEDQFYDSVSIHAPTRGATVLGQPLSARPAFQSTLPRGERRSR